MTYFKKVVFCAFPLLLCSFGMLTYGQVFTVPYSNSFDNIATDTVGWTHYAISGTDVWELGIPDDNSLNSAYSAPNAWVTDLDANYPANSSMALETPYFDLTNTAVQWIFNFQQDKSVGSGSYYFVDYSVDNGNTWQLLDDALAQKKNWMNGTNGFTSPNPIYLQSSIDLGFLAGQDSVKFRFRMTTNMANNEGWAIDNFSIGEAYYNVEAVMGDTIKGANQHFVDFEVNTTYKFQNQWTQSYVFANDFYLSTDSLIDPGDIFLGTVNKTLTATLLNWDITFPLPTGLSAGKYFVIYELDKQNALAEANETDNVNYTVLYLDSIYSTPYSTDFESTQQEWNTGIYSNGSPWKKGDNEEWHIDGSRSGSNAWFNGHPSGGDHYLESPYFDLSGSSNNVLCIWFRSAKTYSFSFELRSPTLNGTNITYPYFATTGPYEDVEEVPFPRHYYWDCYCHDVSDYDNEISTKFVFDGLGSTFPGGTGKSVIDDFYLGPALPDAAVEGERHFRFTTTSSIDTFNYMFYNSGLASLSSTTTEFYWSTDSILDASDVLLGSSAEPAMSDTSFVQRSFTYNKPTTAPGQYYIIYKCDANNVVAEMREYDNVGYFQIEQQSGTNVPYTNDFEIQVDGWKHKATRGNDDWTWSVPQGTVIDTAFSGNKAWITSDTGMVSPVSRMHLLTPIFDLSTLQHPILDWDMYVNEYVPSMTYSHQPSNIMYSVDGGATWNVLDTSGIDFKRMYYGLKYEIMNGEEYPLNGTIASSNYDILYGGHNLKRFLDQTSTYQGRDYDDNHHYSINLDPLKNYDKVRFMFVFASIDGNYDGIMIDNFEITEGQPDLTMPTNYRKSLMVSSADDFIHFFFKVKNNGNSSSELSNVRIYCSTDSIIDAGDVLLSDQDIEILRPYENFLVQMAVETPSNYQNYNYLLCDIDPSNVVTESNEMNNIAVFPLDMDIAETFAYPMFFDFEGDQIDGWTWYHDSTNLYHGHRFRHKAVFYDPCFGSTANPNIHSGFWFLDRMNHITQDNKYPIHYLEAPAFDFSDYTTAEVSFDMLCIGQTSNNNNGALGANMEYSTDGGTTWGVLSTAQDPAPVNWYNASELPYFNDEPGWGYVPVWTHAKFNLQFLTGEPEVRFRFKYHSNENPANSFLTGFRLDNFEIVAHKADLEAIDQNVIAYGQAAIPYINIDYSIKNHGLVDAWVSNTKFTWSNDSILDSTDVELYDIIENPLWADSVNVFNRNIYYPMPITQNVYYLFYEVDLYDDIVEVDDSNNTGYFKVIFDTIPITDLEITGFPSQVLADTASPFYYCEYYYTNSGTYPASSAVTSIYWSADPIYDGTDIPMYNVNEPVIAGGTAQLRSGNFYYPTTVNQDKYYMFIIADKLGTVTESNELNNVAMVEVVFDSVGLTIGSVQDPETTMKVWPVKGKINLQLFGIDQDMEVSIYDLGGRKLVSQNFQSVRNTQIVQLNHSRLSSGLYLVYCHMADQNFTFKVYVND